MKTFFLILAAGSLIAGPLSAKVLSSNQTKEEYAKIVENKVEAWDKIIGQIRDRSFPFLDFDESTAARQANILADELELKLGVVKKDLAKLKEAPGDWKSEQKKIQDELASMRHQSSKLVAE